MTNYSSNDYLMKHSKSWPNLGQIQDTQSSVAIGIEEDKSINVSVTKQLDQYVSQNRNIFDYFGLIEIPGQGREAFQPAPLPLSS